MRRLLFAVSAAALALISAAAANPAGAPWGAANPGAALSCATCHFDYDPALASEAVTLAGLPAHVRGGETYKLTLLLAESDAVVAGFMLSASGGTFAVVSQDVEVRGREARSTKAVAARAGVQWRIDWTAPADLHEDIIFYTAINGANDDASPFGDIIHFRTFAADAEK